MATIRPPVLWQSYTLTVDTSAGRQQTRYGHQELLYDPDYLLRLPAIADNSPASARPSWTPRSHNRHCWPCVRCLDPAKAAHLVLTRPPEIAAGHPREKGIWMLPASERAGDSPSWSPKALTLSPAVELWR
jgi:hypothetical protein